MNQFAYRPGSWQVIAEQHGMIAVPGDTPAERIAVLTAMMRDGAPQLTEVIDVLTGGTISTLGSFAVALLGEGFARVAVRGDIIVAVSGTDGDEVVSGAGISTWTERYITQPRSFAVSLEEARSTPSLIVRSGTVLASSVVFPVAEGLPAADEDAAVAPEQPVQAEPEGEDGGVLAAEAPAPEASAGETQADEPQADDAPADEMPADEAAAETGEESAADAGLAETEAMPIAAANDASGADAGFPTLIPTEYTFAPAPTPMPDDDALDATVHSAPRGPAAPPAAPEGDHDGSTISLAELRRMREEAGETPPQATATAGPDTPTEILPVVENTTAAHGSARLSTGQVVTLDRIVIIGRRPRATRASGDDLPHLVAVDSPQQDISRSHLEIRPEGDSVVVIDLHTTNGSTLLRPGADPMRLHPGEHTLVLSGDVVDLGDGVTVTFEGLT
ncbi:FHA domain-containing protein [Microbacterium sp.]|uniref:FHA domain-containing protein n=1 Tax=Microbacterium sp. TaxID=51671 RepID=UPI0028B1DC9D|nr:FHA domain-containing protein [Microbacterium sp.]